MVSPQKQVLKLLEERPPAEANGNELLSAILITIPNTVDKDVTLMMGGWNIRLHNDGTYSVKKN